MKRPMIFVTCSLLLAGCTEQDRQSRATREAAGSPLEVFVDQETGCQYVSAFQRGLAPRFARNGKQICSLKEPLP